MHSQQPTKCLSQPTDTLTDWGSETLECREFSHFALPRVGRSAHFAVATAGGLPRLPAPPAPTPVKPHVGCLPGRSGSWRFRSGCERARMRNRASARRRRRHAGGGAARGRSALQRRLDLRPFHVGLRPVSRRRLRQPARKAAMCARWGGETMHTFLCSHPES